MKTRIHSILTAIGLFLLTQALHAQGTAFTYQGKLDDGAVSANGKYDFRFRLATDSFGNNYIGNPSFTNGITVSNGLFMTTVDFGANTFNGSNYWLEVDVRTNGAGGYAVLSPLQLVMSTPYAVFAGSASNLVGTISSSQLSGTVNSAVVFTGNLSGDVTGGQSTTVVSSVGGQSSTSVANVVNAANAATDANTPGTIVKRDFSGNFSAGNITLANNLHLPGTTASSGIIYAGSTPFIHNFGVDNFFGGFAAGNFTAAGSDNVGIGQSAFSQSTGNANTAIGYQAMSGHTTGNANIVIGPNAGINLTSGSHNICIGNSGNTIDDGVIRIGDQNTFDAFIPCIYGDVIASGVQVYVNSQGELGVMTSSAKFKQNIESMGNASDVLLALKPVTFQYKTNIDPESIPQFGLVAEDVEKVDPDLVVHDAQHGIYTVRYQAVDAMLLNEFLKEHQKMEMQNKEIQDLKARLERLEQRQF